MSGRAHTGRAGLWRPILCIGLLVCAVAAQSADKPPGAAIASAHQLATEAGFEVLKAGGNAFDAAVAISAALAVVEPTGSGLGGGGFWLLHRAADGHQVMVDGRERAPQAAREDLYLDEDGEYIPGLSRDGPLAAGIPGEPAALAHIAERYGRLPLKQTLAPAIRHARQGFAVDERMHKLTAFRAEVLARWPAAAAVFLDDGRPRPVGSVVRQPDLARSLTLLAEQGRDGFYTGELARRLVAGVREAGGIWTLRDLESYRVVERRPIVFKHRDARIVSASPPSSGGVVLAESLQILQDYPWERLEAVDRKHLVVEAWRRAYRDRAAHLGDPDYVQMPLWRLLSPLYAAGLRASIRLDRATPSDLLDPPGNQAVQGADTTHFSVIDGVGNRVAATLSINLPYGSGFMPPDTGVVLNDEMDDFSAKPLTPNAYGLLGAGANAVAPGKRMLSSMSPTFVETGDRVAVFGTPGGSRIISMVALGILDFVGGADARQMVTRPRYHHQYRPDRILYEPDALSGEERRELERRGHELEESARRYGNMQVVIWDRRRGVLDAASDPRGVGSAAVRPHDPNR